MKRAGDASRAAAADERGQREGDRAGDERHQAEPQGIREGGGGRDLVPGQGGEGAAGERGGPDR